MQLVKNHKVSFEQDHAILDITSEPQEIMTRNGWERVTELQPELERQEIITRFASPRAFGRVILDTKDPARLGEISTRGRVLGYGQGKDSNKEKWHPITWRELVEAERVAGIKYPREMVWIDGAEDISGVIILPYDDYSRVYVVQGAPSNPAIWFIEPGLDGDPKPYYKKPGDGKTYIYVDHFSGGGGVQEDPYLITTAAELDAVRNNLSAYYKQAAGIDLSGFANWVPIGSISDPFNGEYDGSNYEIAGLNINQYAKYVGLFSAVSGAIKRVFIDSCNIIGADLYAGAVCGFLHAGGVLEYCHSKGVVEGRAHIGGVIGNTEPGSAVYRCASDCSIASAGDRAGGLIGTSYAALEECYAAGSVSCGGNYAGGLVGSMHASALNCYAVGAVSAADYVGGLFGSVLNSRGVICVKNSYSTGAVAVAPNAGGLVGATGQGSGYPAPEYTSAYYDAETSGQSDTGKGEPRTTLQMQIQATFADWGFKTIWGINRTLNDGYPYLIWQDLIPEEVIPAYPPGSYIKLQFRAGDSDPYPMCAFYQDRSSFRVGDDTIKLDLRNSIGKYLADQSLDERNIYSPQPLHDLFESILVGAGITNYYVGANSTQVGMEFPPDMGTLEAIEELLKTVRGWMIREEADGKTVVAAKTDAAFARPSRYTFYRNRDIFSRAQTKDDNSAYGRVCVHVSDFNMRVYRPVNSTLGWLPPAQKTYYVAAPEGTTAQDAAALATEIAASLANSGEIEQFVGPFRPQLLPGDEAAIVDQAGPNLLGVLTTVVHRWGKRGFYTEFTVDSGGSIGRPRLKEYLDLIASKAARGSAKRIY